MIFVLHCIYIELHNIKINRALVYCIPSYVLHAIRLTTITLGFKFETKFGTTLRNKYFELKYKIQTDFLKKI